jgi:hypothetical protein
LDEGPITPHHKRPACYEMLDRASELAGSCEHGNEPSVSIKVGNFLTSRVVVKLLKKDSAPWSLVSYSFSQMKFVVIGWKCSRKSFRSTVPDFKKAYPILREALITSYAFLSVSNLQKCD